MGFNVWQRLSSYHYYNCLVSFINILDQYLSSYFLLSSADHSKHGKGHKHKHSSSEEQSTTTTAEATTEQAVTVAIAKRYKKFDPFLFHC